MKRVILIAGILALSGCATSPLNTEQQAKVTKDFANACATYESVKVAAEVQIAKTPLPANQMKALAELEVTGDAICAGPAPTDYATATTLAIRLGAAIQALVGAKS